MEGGWMAMLYAMFFCNFLSRIESYYIPYPTPPLPLSPMPSASQLSFQRREMAMFFHFGMNTFTDREWGDGLTDPNEFNPVGLNTRQWMWIAREAGFKLVILTVKHHDGFCLWQTKYSNYSVQSTSWRNGTGDVFMDFVNAARDAQLDVGFYLSPWDRHEQTYGDTFAYNQYYMAQLRELLTMYGPIYEVWLDGAKGADEKNVSYMFQEWHALIHQLQPRANIFSDAGPDIRWVGNEYGEAGSTCWSMINSTALHIGKSIDVLGYLNSGDACGTDWLPAECDVSIRPGWFWHAGERAWAMETLLDIYYKSAGRNCVLLLNVPPNSTGLISEDDFRTLRHFRFALDDIFAQNFAAGAQVIASSTRGADIIPVIGDDDQNNNNNPFAPSNVLDDSSETYWAAEDGITEAFLCLEFEEEMHFNVVKIHEAIEFGQRISKYSVYVWVEEMKNGKVVVDGGEWEALSRGTTVGYKKLDKGKLVQTRRVRFVIEEARGPPVITSVGLYLDTWSTQVLVGPHQNLPYDIFQ